MIHPLPERFGNQTHIVIHKAGEEEFGESFQAFEPDMNRYVFQPEQHKDLDGVYTKSVEPDRFKPKYRPKRASSPANTKPSIPDVLHVETAIFVDKGELMIN